MIELAPSHSRAHFISTEDKRVRTYPENRVCTNEGCTTVLSRFNRGPECHACAHDFVELEDLYALISAAPGELS